MLGEIVHNLNYDRFKWRFQLFLGINLLSKATFSRHILCRLWMTILSLLTSWFVKGFWSWDVFYTPGWILTGIVVIFAKNQQKKIWEATGSTVQAFIYRTLLENVLKRLKCEIGIHVRGTQEEKWSSLEGRGRREIK